MNENAALETAAWCLGMSIAKKLHEDFSGGW